MLADGRTCVRGHIELINQFVTYLHLIIGTMQCL